ncbi:MAG: ABC transporter substrate-binding protein [Candidatus Rokubacteria bacterium]|nr:ABC transporter substrate-binding protein [Candidatus Rokubacteria bacterium]
MDRRAFLGLAATGVVAAPGVARAQQAGKAHRIGFLSLGSGPAAPVEAFREGLRELGYVEGRNLTIEYRWAAGKAGRLPEMAAELVRLKVEVIVGVTTPVIEAAKRATSTIPIVMAAVADPVGSGLVAGLARPGGNVTGLTLMSTELVGKRLQLVRELLPKATRVAVLSYHGYTSATRPYLEQMRAAAQQMGIQLVVQEVNEARDLPDAFTAMQRERAQALDVRASPFSTENAKRIVELAAQHRLPAMYDVRSFVEAGGLVSYGPSGLEIFRRAAFYVDRILKGAKPADLPIEQPTKFELVINLRAARALGLTIPPALLARADQVIQ